MSKYKITDFSPLDKGSLKGTFDLHIPHFKISGCLYFEKGNKRWIKLPTKQFQKRDGTTGYQDIITVDSEIVERLRKWAVSEIEKLKPPEPGYNDQGFRISPESDPIPF